MEDVAKSPLVGSGHRNLIFVETETNFQLAALRLVDGSRGRRGVLRLALRRVDVSQTNVERRHRSTQLDQLHARRTPQSIGRSRRRVVLVDHVVGSVQTGADPGREERDASTALGGDGPAAADGGAPARDQVRGGAGYTPRSRVESQVAAT